MRKFTPTFEALYDKYSPMLYGIALQISPTEKDAEMILVSTFKKIYRQNINHVTSPSLIVDLIKLTVKTASDKLYPGAKRTGFILKLFENTPLLHRSLCEAKGFESYCSENNLNRAEGFRQMRGEFYLLRTERLVNQAEKSEEHLPDLPLLETAP